MKQNFGMCFGSSCRVGCCLNFLTCSRAVFRATSSGKKLWTSYRFLYFSSSCGKRMRQKVSAASFIPMYVSNGTNLIPDFREISLRKRVAMLVGMARAMRLMSLKWFVAGTIFSSFSRLITPLMFQ